MNPIHPISQMTRCAAALCVALAALCPSVASADNYRMSPGDLVILSVYQEKDLTASYRVSADGTIGVPLVGTVKVGGMTMGEASAVIRKKLLDGYMVNPQVTMRVEDYAKMRFTVLGQVTTPKSISVPANEKLTLLDAIGMAGGATRLANQRKVTVKRKIDGGVEMIQIDVKKMAKGGGVALFFIEDGDVITVSESFF